MYTRRREQDAIARCGERSGLHVALVATPGHDYSSNAGGGRALQHVGAIVIETVMSQVGSDINQFVCHRLKLFPAENCRPDGEENAAQKHQRNQARGDIAQRCTIQNNGPG